MNGQIERSQFINPWRVTGWAFAAALLALHAVAMQFTSEVDWTASDFVVMGVMIGSVGLGLELAIRASRNNRVRAGAAVALLTGFLVAWSNLAVGIIGSEDNPANLMFFAVLLLTVLGAFASRLIPGGMASVMAATAAAQFAVPLIALIAWPQPITPDLLRAILFNSIFALMWLGSARLFASARNA